MTDTIVIGTGLFGSLITRGLTGMGRSVLLIGDERADAGSGPAACLVKPEWTKKLGTDVVDRGMGWLYERFVVHNLPFLERTQSGKERTTLSFFVEPSEMLLKPQVKAQVASIAQGGPSRFNVITSNGVYHSDQVVVAAGVWSQQLVPWRNLGITGKAGCAFLYPEWVGPGFNFMTYWAPFKQIVGFQRGDGFWINDGSAILAQNWDGERTKDSDRRCEEELLKHRSMVRPWPLPKVLYGIRPYVKQKPCLCEEVTPGLWVATGAAKNGTLLGAWCASVISEKSQ
jgi:glycine/D-amino acid oxidase-like deaminating enzyme